MSSNSLYSLAFSPVHRVSIVDDRAFWVWMFSHWNVSDALELLDDMLDDGLVQIETVFDIIPKDYVWTLDHGFVHRGENQ